MNIEIGKCTSFENSIGSKISIYFHPHCIIISGNEYPEEKNGPNAQLRYSYGVHPNTIPALVQLAGAFEGKGYQGVLPAFNPKTERITSRISDAPEDQLLILEQGPGSIDVNLQGSHWLASGEHFKTGGTMPRIWILEADDPDVYQALRGLRLAMEMDNRSRPYPNGWWLQ